MKFIPRSFLLSLITMFSQIMACNGQDSSSQNAVASKSDAEQIGNYVVSIFEDSKGHLWFGTLNKGVARYDGGSLRHFTADDGLPGNAVVSMVEDGEGVLWFATHSGLSSYDGKEFTNYGTADGLPHIRVSNLLIDSKGNFWIGTWAGVCLYDGKSFTEFPLPEPDVDLPPYVETKGWVTEIMEDPKGNIWFGRSGLAACKYDPNTKEFITYTKKDGLASNCVQDILEDKDGNIWFGSRVAERDHPEEDKRIGDGGLTVFNGESFKQFPEVEGLSRNDVYTIYKDSKGNIWVCGVGTGIYQYDGNTFKLYSETDRMEFSSGMAVMGIAEDQNGTLWMGFTGGLFRLEGEGIVNVTTNGPWE